MSGRPAAPTPPATLRVEVLKELQQLVENRDARDRIDKSILAETRGKEHWVLHLLLRALESEQSHVDALVGSAYSNLLARLQELEQRLGHLEEVEAAANSDLNTRFDQSAQVTGEKVAQAMEQGSTQLSATVESVLSESLDRKWKPVGESVETFAQGSRQMLKDVSDTYRVATQTRLLLNENARRMSDLGRDIVALEESLRLVIAKTIEECLAPIEARVAALESPSAGGSTNGTGTDAG